MVTLEVLRDSLAAFRRPRWESVDRIDKGDFEKYLAVGIFLFDSVTRIGEEWYVDVLNKREPFDPRFDEALFGLYSGWAEQGAEIANLIEGLRSHSGSLKHADDFMSCWQKTQRVMAAHPNQEPSPWQNSMLAGLHAQTAEQVGVPTERNRPQTIAFRSDVFSKEDVADLADLRRKHGDAYGRPTRPLRGVPGPS